MGVGNPIGIPFPWESHGNGNSHTAHDGNGNGNKANGNGNGIYFTRENSQNYCDALDQPLKSKSANRAYIHNTNSFTYLCSFIVASLQVRSGFYPISWLSVFLKIS